MNIPMSIAGPILARVYGAVVYLCSLLLIFGAAELTSTHARAAFIFAFLPGILLAVLSVFVWSGRRSAMILAFAVSVVVELIMVGNDPRDWWQLLTMPVVFAALTAAGFLATPQGAVAAGRTADEVYAAAVYFTGLLAAFMAPFNHSRHFGGIGGVALYALLVGVVLGSLSALIWRGKLWAMIATFVLSLAHWLVLAGIDPALWSSIPFIAAPVASGILTVACFTLTSRSSRPNAPAANSPDRS